VTESTEAIGAIHRFSVTSLRGAATEVTREALYVALTRGRDSNTVYVATDAVDADCDTIPDAAERTPYDILQRIVATSGAETSATEGNPGYSVIEVDIDDLMRQQKTILASGIEPDSLRDHRLSLRRAPLQHTKARGHGTLPTDNRSITR
jgi:hypothetical protein